MSYPVANNLRECIERLVDRAHDASLVAGWWDNADVKTNPYVVPAKLMLMVSELAEAMEGDRKDLMDDKLPHRKMIEVELADALLRIADLAGKLQLDLGGAVVEKLQFNEDRPDHKKENRARENGKSY